MADLIGRSLGRYHILEQLGEGGMAVVYKAFDTRLERNVAIKVILPSKEHSEKFLKRFEREAKALAQLSHPNIVKVIDYGEYEGLPYLVMEYLSGGTLKSKLTGKSLSWQEAGMLLLPIARALAYAHEHKIIHRDIKPSNILVTESGEPMLSDFGIAKMLEAEETLDLTGTGVGIGTPEYISPEQAQGKVVDARSDVYSLGIVLYEMVTGRKPYQADTPYAVVIKHVNEPLPRPTNFVKELPTSVEGMLLKSLAKLPSDRFQDMTLFANALEKLVRHSNERRVSGNQVQWRRVISGLLSLLVIMGIIGAAYLLSKPLFQNKILNTPPTSEPVTTQIDQNENNQDGSGGDVSNLLFEENFGDAALNGSFDTSRWVCSSPACGSENISQSNGSLLFADKDGKLGEQYGLETKTFWNIGTIASVSSDLMISDFSGDGNAEIILQINVNNDGADWYTSCNLGGEPGSIYYLCKARTNGLDDYVTKRVIVSKNEWHQARIEFDQAEFQVRYYLDDTLIGSHRPAIAGQFDRLDARIYVSTYSNGNSSLAGQIDNVLIRGSDQGTSETAMLRYGSLLYEEDFETDAGIWSLEKGSTIKDGELVLQPGAATKPNWHTHYSNFIYEAEFRFISPAEIHYTTVYLHYADPPCSAGNCSTQVFVSADGSVAAWRIGPQKVQLMNYTEVPGWDRYAVNKLTVVVENGKFTIFVNGVFVRSFEDTDYNSGIIVLDADSAATAYDSIRLYALP
jgi:serine/threonine protein kinase